MRFYILFSVQIGLKNSPALYWLTRIPTSPGEAHAYLISHSGAKKLLKKLQNVFVPVDILMGQPWRTHLAALSVVSQKLAYQDSKIESQIGFQRFSKNKSLKGFEKIVHPFAKTFLKVVENIFLKRLFYYGALPKDLITRYLYSKKF